MNRTSRLLLGLILVLPIAAAACGDDDSTSSGDNPAVVIGAQDFGESAVLSEVYRQALESVGIDASVKSLGSGAFREAELAAFDDGTINFAAEYAASMLEFLNDKKGEATSDAQETTDKLQTYLDDIDLVAFDATEAVDTNAFVMTKEKSDELGITSLSDLAEKGADLTIGAPNDCVDNPFCVAGLKTVYGIDVTDNVQELDPGLILDSLKGGTIDVGVMFSSDSRISTENLVLLEDDKGMLGADNVVPVATKEVADAYGSDLSDILDKVNAKLTTDALIEMNARYDGGDDPDAIAKDWLQDNGII